MRNRLPTKSAVAVLALSLPAGWVVAQQPKPIIESIWSTPGDGFDFYGPTDIDVAPDGTILVVDNATVYRMDECANLLDYWQPGFGFQSISVDSDGNVYLFHGQSFSIRVYDIEGVPLRQWGSQGSSLGEFGDSSVLVAVSNDGIVYAAEYVNNRVQVFDTYGNLLDVWNGGGAGESYFIYPLRVFVDPTGAVFLHSFANVNPANIYQLQKFDSEGTLLERWLAPESDDSPLLGRSGNGIAFDAKGNIYTTGSSACAGACGTGHVQKFSSKGQFLAKWRGGTVTEDFLIDPKGIAVDAKGSIYVGDLGYGGRIFKYVQPYVLSCPPGDFDGDCDSDVADFIAMTLTMTGPLQPAIVVDASCLATDTASAGSYFSNGNDLRGFATQDGYTESNWTIAWTVDSKPVGSGSVAIFDPGLLESAFVITAPAVAGDYIFRLTVTNPTTNTQATDTVSLTLTP